MNQYGIQPENTGEFDDISGVAKVGDIMRRRRDAFNEVYIGLESDRYLKHLVAFGSKLEGRPEHGLLQKTLLKLRDFEDKFLFKTEPFFDAEGQLADLEEIFNKAMETIVSKWTMLAAQGYDWNMLCDALFKHTWSVAQVFGLGDQMSQKMHAWFASYNQKETTKAKQREDEAKYIERDRLNAEAIRAQSEFSYYATVGADKKIIENVRNRIDSINDQLRHLPVDPNNLAPYTTEWVQAEGAKYGHQEPLYATRSVERKPAVNPQTEEVTKISRRPSPVPPTPEKKSWLKKIPLIGRWF